MRISKALTLAALLHGVCFAAAADDPALASFKGIKAVVVWVADLNATAESFGLTRDKIQADVETRLRAAGVHVLKSSPQEMRADWGCVYVHVHIVKSSDENTPVATCSIHVSLMQLAKLFRDPNQIVSATTCRVSHLSLATLDRVEHQANREAIPDLIDQFAKTYFTANPRPPTTQPSATSQP